MRRRYRDMFKGVAEANAHFSELFVGMGLVQLSSSHIQHRWEGPHEGRNLQISLTNSGRFEVTMSLLEVSIPMSVEALVAVGASVPPLRRSGTKPFDSPRQGIKCYSHDAGWGTTMLETNAGSRTIERLDDGHFLQIRPGHLVWQGDILHRDDSWVREQLDVLSALAAQCERLPPPTEVPDSLLRRHAGTIAIGLGCLAVALIAALMIVAAVVFG